MIKIQKLYSEPQIFDPIIFDYGLNIIMGEGSESSDKKIGVGKSICVEFINFCLLKDFKYSRLSLIPKNAINIEADIKLDILMNKHQLTIIRSISDSDHVVIYKNGERIVFDKIDDAKEFLNNLYYEYYTSKKPRIGLRTLLHPIIREEKSEFKDIIQCFDTDKRIPPDYTPHLFLFDISLELYTSIRGTASKIEKKNAYIRETKQLITKNNQLTITKAKARLNELEGEVVKLNNSVEQLKNNESFDLIQKEIITIEDKLRKLRDKQKSIRFRIKQIDTLPEVENIPTDDISIIFNQFKQGLGDMIERSINEVVEFKNKIDDFRNYLVNEQLESLKCELIGINDQLNILDGEYSQKVSLLDTNGNLLRDLKTSLNIFNTKNKDYNELRALISNYDEATKDKKKLATTKSELSTKLDNNISNIKETTINSFSKSILDAHERIMGSREAFFDIEVINKANNKYPVEFILRIQDDGSHTTDRMRVFIYDISLLLNEYTHRKHPLFLIHDNLFDKDDDSLEKSLNYIFDQNMSSTFEFQYILTLNRDLVESIVKKQTLKFDIEDYKIASFTKDKRFLKCKYSEIK
ncbi:DUF2326 domain-containing protein [Dysgonomonas capnocytophagoides]|uniref:DUF2326 domain-containing protein n=1 Tax=Dysgonomonas capnocytophagoides TaxID=45254 RepID=UPI003991DFCD